MGYYKRFSDRRAYIKLMWSSTTYIDIGGATTYNYGVDLGGVGVILIKTCIDGVLNLH